MRGSKSRIEGAEAAPEEAAAPGVVGATPRDRGPESAGPTALIQPIIHSMLDRVPGERFPAGAAAFPSRTGVRAGGRSQRGSPARSQ